MTASPAEHFCFYCFMQSNITAVSTTTISVDFQTLTLPTQFDGKISQYFSGYYAHQNGFGYIGTDSGIATNQMMVGGTTTKISVTKGSISVGSGGNQLIFGVATGSPLPKAAWVHIYVDNTGKTGNLTSDLTSLTYQYGCFFESSSLPRTPCKAFTLGANYFSFQAPDGADDPDFLQSFTLTLSHVSCANTTSLEGTSAYLMVKTC